MNLFRRIGIKKLSLLLILIAVPITIIALQKQQDVRQRASEGSNIDYYGKSIQTFGLFGQSDFRSATRKKVSANAAYHGSGVTVDKQNHIYFVDSGNNRILGFRDGNGNDRTADIVIGQPNFSSGSCNHDSNLGFKKTPVGPDMICLMQYPIGNNTAEQWGGSNIDTDSEGNLYVTDSMNNRVLRYDRPFETDTVADFVWGQDDFAKNTPNKGPGFFGTIPPPNNTTLNTSRGYGNPTATGVSVDPIDGGIWVGDFYNNRILHFPMNSKTADVVIGQPNMTTTGCSRGQGTTLCSSILAKRDPASGELYVLDMWPEGFQARFVVYRKDGNGVWQFNRQFIPHADSRDTVFKASGFTFNTFKPTEAEVNANENLRKYKDGLLFVNEHEKFRTLLIDANGNIKHILGASPTTFAGRDQAYVGCDANVYQGNRISWPNGGIGMDSSNNIYLADEDNGRVIRYTLPYEYYSYTYTYEGTTYHSLCPPAGSASLLQRRWNLPSLDTLGEANGIATYQNQLIIVDEGGVVKVWNDYKNKPAGSAADFQVGPNTVGGGFLSGAIDDTGKLWMVGQDGTILVQQLPFANAAQLPVGNRLPLYWADDNQPIAGWTDGMAFDPVGKAMYFDQGNRILRVKNYKDLNHLVVDMVIGQADKTNNQCNQGRGESQPTANSLCAPHTQIKFDKLGNLYVVEDAWESHGNRRIVVFLKEDLQSAQGLFSNIAAKKVFNAPNFTAQGNMSYSTSNAPGTPIGIAFNAKNQLVVSNDGYYGDITQRELKQLWFYADPLNKQTPDASISLYMGTGTDMAFDENDNLLIRDGTWYRTTMLNLCTDPEWFSYLPGASSINACSADQPTQVPPTATTTPIAPTSTPINTPTPTLAQPTATIIPTATLTPAVPTNTPTTNPCNPLNPNCVVSITPTLSQDTPTPTPVLLTGDIDGNGCVDILDFNIWLTAVVSDQMTPNTYPDVNNDGALDIVDFNLWLSALRSGQNACQ